ncbi:MAG: guanylate kinase [Anaerolineales bacterium]|nr:guanylate kinase [Anaerolineales bacterium]MCS7249026.1 guanylate kinase [Anaerolineales bacterium]MDW8162839.1 guanylate kinase [Anaerolineales bacterium]MDW8447740.1 guanylate kinase [Anaerolineales bacterium]
MHPSSQPLLIVISGPSGAGKDSVIKALQARGLPIHFVVTATTRAKRSNEVEGVDYFFVTRQRFEEMIAQDELIEYAMVYGEYKGVPRRQVVEALASGKDVVLRVDVQGALALRKQFPQAVLIFLSAEDLDETAQRLESRSTEEEEELRRRLDTAKWELEHLWEFDYWVVNRRGQLDQTVDTIIAIIQAEHHRICRQRSLP